MKQNAENLRRRMIFGFSFFERLRRLLKNLYRFAASRYFRGTIIRRGQRLSPDGRKLQRVFSTFKRDK